MTNPSSDVLERFEVAESGIRVAMVASCDCDHEANISPSPEAHTDTCQYRVLYVSADALADVRATIERLSAELALANSRIAEMEAANG